MLINPKRKYGKDISGTYAHRPFILYLKYSRPVNHCMYKLVYNTLPAQRHTYIFCSNASVFVHFGYDWHSCSVYFSLMYNSPNTTVYLM